jgi:hypothetical protein
MLIGCMLTARTNLLATADPSDPRALWPYNPTFGAAILFTVLFGIVTVAHIIEWCIYKKVGSAHCPNSEP